MTTYSPAPQLKLGSACDLYRASAFAAWNGFRNAFEEAVPQLLVLLFKLVELPRSSFSQAPMADRISAAGDPCIQRHTCLLIWELSTFGSGLCLMAHGLLV